MNGSQGVFDNTYYLGIAADSAKLSDCQRRTVGAVIVRNGLIVGHGWNQSSMKGKSCKAGDCPRGLQTYQELPAYAPYDNCISVHAEIVALRAYAHLLYHIKFNTGVDGWAKALQPSPVMFATDKPCDECAAELDRVGMEVVW